MVEKSVNEENIEINPFKEIHTTYARSAWGLALQAFSALGTAFMLYIVFYGAEWKGSVDTNMTRFEAFIEKGDRFPLERGARLETRIVTHEREHDEDMRDLRQEWIAELRLIRQDIKDARQHTHK